MYRAVLLTALAKLETFFYASVRDGLPFNIRTHERLLRKDEKKDEFEISID